MSVADFEQKYVRQVGIRKSLIEYANGDCVFFDGKARKCTVYDARPRQCRTWPFWQSNVATKEAWKQTCEVCPGSGKGKLHPVEQILHQISIVKALSDCALARCHRRARTARTRSASHAAAPAAADARSSLDDFRISLNFAGCRRR